MIRKSLAQGSDGGQREKDIPDGARMNNQNGSG
jgi:hypothetical protein